MFIAWNFLPLLLAALLSYHESETSMTVFTSKPSNPSIAVAGSNFTLEWTYTLDGTVHVFQFYEVIGNKNILIGKGEGPGNITAMQKYQSRFKAQATNTRAELKILAVQRSDESKYRMNVNPSGSGSLTHDVTVIVHYQPSITLISGNQTVKVGDVVWLICTADGFPAPTITWTRLSNSRDVNIPMTITGKQDEGFYMCTASNGVGNPASADVFIAVHYPVKATGNGENATVAEGQVQRFVCPVDGNPEPHIEWYSKNTGRKLSSGKQYETGKSGCYFCAASNYLGSPVNITHCLIIDTNLTVEPITTVTQPNTASTTYTSNLASTEAEAGPPWAMMEVMAGSVVALMIVVGIFIWRVHKLKRRRKDTINNADISDLGRCGDEGGYLQVQVPLEPPAANGTDTTPEQQIKAEATIHTYATVKNSKKTEKEANERSAECAVEDKCKKKEKQEVAAIPTYAAVDKSNKKKKSTQEVPAVYAEVDKSKMKIDDKKPYETLDEPKKKKKPGERLYADFGGFQHPDMPAESNSLQPLPAIKS